MRSDSAASVHRMAMARRERRSVIYAAIVMVAAQVLWLGVRHGGDAHTACAAISIITTLAIGGLGLWLCRPRERLIGEGLALPAAGGYLNYEPSGRSYLRVQLPDGRIARVPRHGTPSFFEFDFPRVPVVWRAGARRVTCIDLRGEPVPGTIEPRAPLPRARLIRETRTSGAP